jgi:hypothetical protein
MTSQPKTILDDPTRRLHMNFKITPALVEDVARILVQQGWEISLLSAIPQAQQILERVQKDIEDTVVEASLPEPQTVKEEWVKPDPLNMEGKPCDCGRSYCKKMAGQPYPGVCQDEEGLV